MNKKIVITITLISFYSIVIAQWQQLETYPENESSRYIVFLNDTMVVSNLSLPAAIYTSSDYGESWNSNTNLGIGAEPLITHGGLLYAATWGEGIFLSMDMGYSWIPKNNGLQDLSFLDLISHDDKLYACRNYIYYSEDNGDNWIDISHPNHIQATCIVVAGNTIISSFSVTSSGWGVYKSTDNGANWTLIDPSTGIEDNWLEKLSFFNNTIFASASMGTGSVYVSNDLGESWTAGNGLEDQGYNQIYDFVDHYGTIYAASMNGVYKSEDFGLSWSYFGCTNTLDFAIAGDTLYAGTGYMGLWKHGLPPGSNECLPNGIEFHTQEEIDNFQTNYPYCTEIEGDVKIDGPWIENLNGLSAITSIGGKLQIGDGFSTNPQLEDLNGLENITYIGEQLMINNNLGLVSTNGLNNVAYIGEYIYIGDNPLLEDINGLINITTINGNLKVENNNSLTSLLEFEPITAVEGDLGISNNNSLISLSGLHNITEVGENLAISENDLLMNLDGLDNISSIGDHLIINDNLNLLSLTGLENITYVPEDLAILNNPSLTSFSGLHNLTWIDKNLEIFNNDALVHITGLESLLGAKTLYLWDNDSLKNLDGLSSSNFEWTLTVDNNQSLENLDGLQSITSLQAIYVRHNFSLQSLNGLNNLSNAGTSVSGVEIIDNASLSSLNGLENLSHINGKLKLMDNPLLPNLDGLSELATITGNFEIVNNNSLISLIGLNNLTEIKEDIIIENNDALASIEGLSNINPNLIEYLKIIDNPSLSTCHIQCICDYLISLNGYSVIEDNAPGCNNSQEVEDACEGVGIEESFIDIDKEFTVFPNPANNEITIQRKNQLKIKEITIFNKLGEVAVFQLNPSSKINISSLSHGIYIIEIKTKDFTFLDKLIVK